jgi:hypothetical protein
MEKLLSKFITNILLASLFYSCTGSSKNSEYTELKAEVSAFEKKVQNTKKKIILNLVNKKTNTPPENGWSICFAIQIQTKMRIKEPNPHLPNS